MDLAWETGKTQGRGSLPLGLGVGRRERKCWPTLPPHVDPAGSPAWERAGGAEPEGFLSAGPGLRCRSTGGPGGRGLRGAGRGRPECRGDS